jgi:hypothetical protein
MRQFTKPKQTVNISNGKVKNWYGRSLLRGNSIAYSLLQSVSFVVNVGALCAPKKIIFLKQASTKRTSALFQNFCAKFRSSTRCNIKIRVTDRL